MQTNPMKKVSRKNTKDRTVMMSDFDSLLGRISNSFTEMTNYMNERFQKVDERFEKIDDQFLEVRQDILIFRKEVDERFDRLEYVTLKHSERIEALEHAKA